MDCYQFCYHPQSKKPRKSLTYKAFTVLAERATASAELSGYFRTFHSISLIKFLLWQQTDFRFHSISCRIIQTRNLWLVS